MVGQTKEILAENGQPLCGNADVSVALDLKEKKAQGMHVNSRDIKKHRLDVFRLFQLIREDQKILVPESIAQDVSSFTEQMRESEMRLTDIGISRSKDSIFDIFSGMYVVNQ